jgi:hypothetical protein
VKGRKNFLEERCLAVMQRTFLWRHSEQASSLRVSAPGTWSGFRTLFPTGKKRAMMRANTLSSGYGEDKPPHDFTKFEFLGNSQAARW